jgi:signal transduction histidine kinase
MVGTYNGWLVVVSVVVAILASYVALDLASRCSVWQGHKAAWYWQTGGAISQGSGIWSMHFVGMLAFRLPIPMSYDVSPQNINDVWLAGAVGGFSLVYLAATLLISAFDAYRAERARKLADSLRQAYSELEARVAERTAELARTNQALLEQITERRRAEAALREADRHKDEFLAMLAHELRNPLAPIRNSVEVLQRLKLEEPKLDRASTAIDRQVGQLTRLIDDLLDVSRISRGNVSLQKAPIELAMIVERALETSRPVIEARRHHLSVGLPAEPVCLEGDLVRLTQALGNLLNNAAKYTEEGGRIGLVADQTEGHVVLRVHDTGAGIPAAALPYVFDVFTQGDRTLDRAQGGLGIGLALVKKLVELHGGRVEASGRAREASSPCACPPGPGGQRHSPDPSAKAPRRRPGACGSWWSTTIRIPPRPWRCCSTSKGMRRGPRSMARRHWRRPKSSGPS